MIQRIQSIYLLLVSLLFGVLFSLRIGDFHLIIKDGTKETWNYYLHYILRASDGTIIHTNNNTYLTLTAILIALLSIITIFLYRKRLTQLKLCKLGFFLNIVFIGLFFFYSDFELKQDNPGSTIEIDYGFSVLVPLVTLTLLLLASKAIKKDEDLVRSADRLR